MRYPAGTIDKYRRLLEEIESQWPTHIRRGFTELIRSHPNEVFYAAAFWMFYCDYTVIAAPTFGVNAESKVTDSPDDRWAPAEWGWDVVQSVQDGMEPFYEQLSSALAGAPDAEWEAVMAANEKLIGRVAQLVTEWVKNRSGEFADFPLPKDFLVFAGDVREDAATFNRQLRLSVKSNTLLKLGLLAAEE